MWFIFLHLRGLGRSSMAQYYCLANAAEAMAFLAHELLGSRLVEICEAAWPLCEGAARSVFGSPDDKELR